MKPFLLPVAGILKNASSAVILLLLALSLKAQTVDYGKSYLNVTKGAGGGTIEPGDTLEIRATFVVKTGTAKNCSFIDTIPANTTFLPGTIRVLTDEGVIYQQLTDAADGDGGTFNGTSVLINMGTGATASSGGTLTSSGKPSLYYNSCIVIAAYRVVVNPSVAYETRLQLGSGVLSYTTSSGVITPVPFPIDSAIVHPNQGLCSNVQGANALLEESGGSFGSGNAKDRSASITVPATYSFVTFSSTAGMPDDYYYGVSNNTSGGPTVATGYSAVNTWPYPDNSNPSHRIFGSWDIIGDHTGASNPALGNPATDDNAGQSGGYMLVINSSYRTNITFIDTVKNLCPLTDYTYSAWFRNLCHNCGCDSNGNAWSDPGYHPQAPGDSTGIHPNLTFSVNGLDYYTTGEIHYTGTWVQKGFVYHTGPGQTSMVVMLRNNAPGGGGNDWALDDISVSSCSPSVSITDANAIECQGTMDTVSFLVSSTSNTYTAYQLQKSVDGGVTWTSPGTDTTGLPDNGIAVPMLNTADNQFEYTISRNYGLNTIDTSIEYRLIVSDGSSNLSNPGCSFTGSQVKTIKAVNCMIVLPVSILSFRGKVENGLASLQWITTNETGQEIYTVERSTDGIHFTTAGIVQAALPANTGIPYHFTDPVAVNGQTCYRIRLSAANYYKYSNQIILSNDNTSYAITSIVNPFTDNISFGLATSADGIATITLMDNVGRIVSRQNQPVQKGDSQMVLSGLGNLPAGVYSLLVQYGDRQLSKRMLKLTR